MGDLSRASIKEICVAAFCLIIGFVLLYAQARKLNLIVQGEDTALHLVSIWKEQNNGCWL